MSENLLPVHALLSEAAVKSLGNESQQNLIGNIAGDYFDLKRECEELRKDAEAFRAIAGSCYGNYKLDVSSSTNGHFYSWWFVYDKRGRIIDRGVTCDVDPREAVLSAKSKIDNILNNLPAIQLFKINDGESRGDIHCPRCECVLNVNRDGETDG